MSAKGSDIATESNSRLWLARPSWTDQCCLYSPAVEPFSLLERPRHSFSLSLSAPSSLPHGRLILAKLSLQVD